MPDDLAITIHDDVPVREAALIDAGLGASNLAAAPLHDGRPVSCFARVDGLVVGGAIGRTWGACGELQQLWVAPAHRRHGLGAGLVRAFEQRAAARGCRIFYLETFSFRAPALYAALGYAVRHELRGFAPGVVKYLMVREASN